HFGPRLTALAGLLIGHYRMSRRSAVDLLGRLLDVPAPSLGSTEACQAPGGYQLNAYPFPYRRMLFHRPARKRHVSSPANTA
ncbi:MAG TPA: hypothetical protein VHG08_10195, partial [Longimicrobium sp.]|nr:hypothetical protein [Longimicrobium sp.]